MSSTEHSGVENALIVETIDPALPAEPLIGEPDAATEWQDKSHGYRRFLHTRSYEHALRRNVLFIFGRRGTGKTSVMRMLAFETRLGHLSDYGCSWTLNEESAYRELAIAIRQGSLSELPDAELEYEIARQWKWILTTAAMCGLVSQAQFTAEYLEPVRDALRTVRRYLTASGLVVEGPQGRIKPKADPVRLVADTVGEVSDETFKVAQTIGKTAEAVTLAAHVVTKLMKRLLTPDYEQAVEAFQNALEVLGRSALVLVDSTDEYRLDDKVSRCVTTALMRASVDFAMHNREERIYVKAAFPLELQGHLRLWNPEKLRAHTTFIDWSHRELVALVAKRYRYYTLDTEEAVSDDVSLEDGVAARQYLEQFLPERVSVCGGIELDTLYYVFRYTQKKPRQVISAFNSILSVARLWGLPPAASISVDAVRSGMHHYLQTAPEGVYRVFELIYPKATEIVERSLGGRPALFAEHELNAFIKDATALRRQADLSVEDVRNLLVEAGVIGKVTDTSYCVSTAGKRVTLHRAEFQYQAPGLTLSSDNTLAIHPMFYQRFGTVRDRSHLVCPQPSEGECLLYREKPTRPRVVRFED
jgi:hypothetical protein